MAQKSCPSASQLIVLFTFFFGGGFLADTMNEPFRSKRLLYRAVENDGEDKAFFHSIQSDVHAYANSNSSLLKPPSTNNSARFQSYVVEKTLLGVVICLPGAAAESSPIPIGCIYLTKPQAGHEHHRNSNISVDIVSGYRKQGYGSEAIQWALDWGFRVAGLHRIGIEGYSWNERAMKLYERLGFVMEGRQRESHWYNGGWHDYLSFSMLEGEWAIRQKSK